MAGYFAVGEFVEAEKFVDSWYRARVKQTPGRGSGGDTYEVEFPGFGASKNLVLPASKVRAIAGSSTRRQQAPASSRGATEEPRARLGSTLSRMRESRLVDEQSAEAVQPQQQQQQQQASQHPGSYQAGQPFARPAWPEEQPQPEKPQPSQYTNAAAASAERSARGAQASVDEVSKRLDKAEAAWEEREQFWMSALDDQTSKREALAGDLEAERERLAVEQQRTRDVSHELMSARTSLDELRNEFEDHKELFKAAVKPLQDAVPELQQDCAEIRTELALAADELGVHGEAQTSVKEIAMSVADALDRIEGMVVTLEGESDDQRDAIGALMDLLEKTMTVDDASELSDQITETIDQKHSQLAARCDEQVSALLIYQSPACSTDPLTIPTAV